MKEHQVVVREDTAVQAQPPAERMIVMIMDAARDKSIDIDKLERLMAMQERMVADQRKTAYVSAMARLQAKLPQIDQNGRIVVKGALRSKYALIEDIDVAIRPLLAEEGFSYSCNQEDSPDGKLRRFAGKMSHRDGHEEVKHFSLPFDSSEFRSAVQSEKSTYSYASRVLLTMHLNLVTRDVDTDGAPSATITDDQVKDIEAALDELKMDRARFLVYMHVGAVADILAKDHQKAIVALDVKRRGVK